MLAEKSLEKHQIIIENVSPEIDCGRYPIKRVTGDCLQVEADIFRDGHDLISAALLYRFADTPAESATPAKSRSKKTAADTAVSWSEVPFEPVINDRWKAEFPVYQVGRCFYTIEAWSDRFGTWHHDMVKRVEATQVSSSDVLEGLAIANDILTRINNAQETARVTALINAAEPIAVSNPIEAGRLFLDAEVVSILNRYPDRSNATRYRELEVVVDVDQARFAAWYEFFPRSQSPDPSRSGTFQDAIRQLPRVAQMGFDVVYLPPIHPIGRSNRKGPNNTLNPGPFDPGSPWAIGNENGGHKSIDPSLGTFEDFDQFVKAATEQGISVALDFAIQCSPDHPYVKSHPEWFFVRPDGTIKYAENPPKKYQDIYPINFYNSNKEALWEELKSIVTFWISHGVKIFRVDNPHTKPFPFWQWLISEIKKDYPEVTFLAEAFTRPKVMRELAKMGFSQSYTYFTWRTARWELIEYLTELTQSEMKEYYRGNLWPNTPDILHDFLQKGGIPAFKLRLVLAATLSSLYGIYSGYELGINVPIREGSEEYYNSDKYQVNYYDWTKPENFSQFIARVNKIRHENRALHLYDNLAFYRADDNEQIVVYGKMTPAKDNIILVVVNLDPNNVQSAWVGVPYWDWGVRSGESYQVYDLLTDTAYTWSGEYNFVQLDPRTQPAHIFQIRRLGR